MSHGPPTLVYDGDCAICRYWVTYWQGLTNERVVYRPYQEAATDFPTIPLEAFQRAIQFIERDGARVFRRGRNIPRSAPGAGARGVVVVLFTPTRFRGDERMGLRRRRSPSRPP